MTNLVIAEHDNASIKPATLNTVTAAVACGGDVHVLVAGEGAAQAAAAAAQIAGVTKVIHADGASLKSALAENVATPTVRGKNGELSASRTKALLAKIGRASCRERV